MDLNCFELEDEVKSRRIFLLQVDMMFIFCVRCCIFRQLRKNLSINQIDAETVRQKMEEINFLQNGQAHTFSRLRSNRLLVAAQYCSFIRNKF